MPRAMAMKPVTTVPLIAVYALLLRQYAVTDNVSLMKTVETVLVTAAAINHLALTIILWMAMVTVLQSRQIVLI